MFGLLDIINNSVNMRKVNLFYSFSKRVIKMKKNHVKIDLFEQSAQEQKQDEDVSQIIRAREEIPGDWEKMPFDQLCALPKEILQALQLEVTKDKFSVNEDRFRITPLLKEPEKQLNPYWSNIYRTLRLESQISLKKLQQKEGDLSTMFLEHPFEDESLLLTIQKFVDNLRFPKKLEGIAEPSFVKYLLTLRRDLLLQGADIDIGYNKEGEDKFRKVKLLKIINNEHQFWCDVKQNRLKNSLEDNFIIQSKIIQNPNSTILLLEKYPKLKMTYISRKRKSKDPSMNFCDKIDILVEVEGQKHVVRVERISMAKNFNEVNKKGEYLVIDFDYLMRGNPTIKPVFQF